MQPIVSRRNVVVLLVASAVGVGSLLAPASAPADQALFRVERKFFGPAQPAIAGSAPESPNGSPGGAGRYIAFVEPFLYTFPNTPATADVKAGNPVGSPFTLPARFIDTSFMVTRTAKTGFPGYDSKGTYVYHNAIGRFGPNNGAGTPGGAPTPTRVVFPTTQGNSLPNPASTKNINYGTGNPVISTTTFDGRYDFSRVGSINVSAGANRFGGTMRFLNGPGNSFYQFVFRYSPTSVFKAYGKTRCQRAGIDCTSDPSGPFGPEEIGEITSSFTAVRFLLNQNKLTGTGKHLNTATAKATTPATPSGTARQWAWAERQAAHPPATGSRGTTTCTCSTRGRPALARSTTTRQLPRITPNIRATTTSLGGADITVTNIGTSAMWNLGQETVTYTTNTYKQYLTGVQRVVSLVKPRLIHVYEKPLSKTDPFIT